MTLATAAMYIASGVTWMQTIMIHKLVSQAMLCITRWKGRGICMFPTNRMGTGIKNVGHGNYLVNEFKLSSLDTALVHVVQSWYLP